MKTVLFFVKSVNETSPKIKEYPSWLIKPGDIIEDKQPTVIIGWVIWNNEKREELRLIKNLAKFCIKYPDTSLTLPSYCNHKNHIMKRTAKLIRQTKLRERDLYLSRAKQLID